MKSKKEKEKTAEYTAGSHAAFIEAAEICRRAACDYFLNLDDAAAQALRGMVRRFLDEAARCSSIEDEA